MVFASGLRADIRFALQTLPDPRRRRHFLWWLRSKQRDYLLNAACPWLTFDAIVALRERVWPGMRVFEFGSGGSTLFWLAKGASQIVSIEHDPAWHGVVLARTADRQEVKLRLVLPEAAGTEGGLHDPADPALFQSDDDAFRGFSFERYVRQIDTFPDGYFDVLLVDGRARPACIAHGARKVKPGGLLILDNAERAYYIAQTRRFLRDFRRELFTGMVPQVPVLSATAIYTRGQQPRD